MVTGANFGSSTSSNHARPCLRTSSERSSAPATSGTTINTSTEVSSTLKRHRQRRGPVHEKLHDRHEQHQHDEVVHGDLHERIGRVAVGQVAPDKHHRRAGRGGQNDAAGDVLIGFGGLMKAAKTKRKNDPRQQRHREGFHHPVDEQRDQQPGGSPPTLRTEEKSTFIIIGVIMSQIRTAIGALIWLPCAEFHTAQARDGARAGAFPSRCPPPCRAPPIPTGSARNVPSRRLPGRVQCDCFSHCLLLASVHAQQPGAQQRPGRLHGADERAHELAFHLRGDRVHIDALAAQERRAHPRCCKCAWVRCRCSSKPASASLRDVLDLFKRARDAADPQQHVLPHFGRHLAARDDIGDGEAAAGLQHAERLAQHAVLVAREVDHAIAR